MSFLVLTASKVFLGGGLPSFDRVKLSEGVLASVAALRVSRRVEDTKESPFTMIGRSEWANDVGHSKLVVSRGVDVIHLAKLSARARLVFGLDFHNLAKRELERVS